MAGLPKCSDAMTDPRVTAGDVRHFQLESGREARTNPDCAKIVAASGESTPFKSGVQLQSAGDTAAYSPARVRLLSSALRRP